jgi:hypothetical protein
VPSSPPSLVCTPYAALALAQVCNNPRDPVFNHYIFETLAVLLKTVQGIKPAAAVVDELEALLFPPFQAILQRDIVEFHPYVPWPPPAAWSVVVARHPPCMPVVCGGSSASPVHACGLWW